jgi:hypothetical protein
VREPQVAREVQVARERLVANEVPAVRELRAAREPCSVSSRPWFQPCEQERLYSRKAYSHSGG